MRANTEEVEIREDEGLSKPLALLLAMLIALTSADAAAAGVKYETYQNEANGYSIDYPADWTLLSKETLRSNPDRLAEAEGMSASAVETYAPRIEAKDMAVIVSGDGAVNAAIGYQSVPAKFDSKEIVKNVYPAVLQQLEGVFEDYAPLAEPQVVKFGRREFVETAGRYTLSGVNIVVMQAFHCTGSTLYTIALTMTSSVGPDMNEMKDISDAMLASFKPA